MSYPADRLARARRLLDAWVEGQSQPDTATVTLHRAVIDRYALDVRARHNVLEPSLSVGPEGADRHRFSYGFPTYRSERSLVEDTVLRFVEPFGRAVEEACRPFLRAALSPCVQIPIFGFTGGRSGAPRVKLYLLFQPGRDAEARALARALLRAGHPFDGVAGALHMVGVDLGPQGIVRAKLYFEHASLTFTEAARALRLPQLLPEGTILRRALYVHEVKGPDDDGWRAPAGVDFSLGAAGAVEWEALSPALEASWPGLAGAVTEIDERFGVRVTRVSLFRERANAYYVLA